jgi:hypothetical protein
MNRILKILIKEILFYWIVASIILFTFAFVYNAGYIFKILSFLSIIISKVIYEQNIANFYSQQKEIKTYSQNYFDELER